MINYALARCELRKFPLADVTGFWKPSMGFLMSIVLKVTMIGGIDFDITRKRRDRKVSQRRFSTSAKNIPCFFHTLQKDSLLFYFFHHYGVTLLGIFLPNFSDPTNIIFLCCHTILQPIPFVLVVLDKSAKINCASANLKPMT